MGRVQYRIAVAVFSIMPASAFAAAEAASEEQRAQHQTIQLPKTERLVCRREPVIGSHLSKRVCRSQREIAADREAARDALDSLGRASSINARRRRGG